MMKGTNGALALATAMLLGACGAADNDNAATAQERGMDGRFASAYASGSDRLTPDQLEADRMNMDWRQWTERDTTSSDSVSADSGGSAADTADGGSTTSAAADETWEDITPESVNSGAVLLPVFGDVSGPSVLRVQVLLDRAQFSPGIVDGRWGRNTEKAVYWLQKREGLDATGEVDERTWQRLVELAGEPQQLARTHTLTAEDVEGPFVTLPEEYYDRRDLDCQCYESLPEKLAEMFHTSQELLAKLNPDVDLSGVSAGTALNVPHVRQQGGADAAAAPDQPANAQGGSASVARIVISDGGGYLHALDESGRILYHFPATLGADYSPSPSGELEITAIAQDPEWHYQPDLLEGVANDEPDAVLPPGPNNAVGVVWMQLSKPHYGIHGTSAPETIGYATSNGCIRLTNWDARFLSHRVEEGIPVEFRDVT